MLRAGAALGGLGCHPPLSLGLRGPLCFVGQCPERLPTWPEHPTPDRPPLVHVMNLLRCGPLETTFGTENKAASHHRASPEPPFPFTLCPGLCPPPPGRRPQGNLCAPLEGEGEVLLSHYGGAQEAKECLERHTGKIVELLPRDLGQPLESGECPIPGAEPSASAVL